MTQVTHGLTRDELVKRVHPSNKSVTLSKHHFRQICNAYINAVNLTQQLLMVHRGDNPLSDAAVGRLEGGLRVMIQQLKEVIDGETDIPSA